MQLLKPHLDIGLFCNDIDAHTEFWGEKVGLRLDHLLELEPGWVQHRYDANGSVIKVNHRATPLPPRPPSGFAGLTIAGTGHREWSGDHPGGQRVSVVEPGHHGVTGIAVTISTPNPGRLIDFYCTALEFDQVDQGTVRCGDSLVFIVEGEGGRDVDDFAATGFRYLTVQVADADREIDGILDRGGRLARATTNLAGVARYGFVADPDGNWTEISARTSLTGIEVT